MTLHSAAIHFSQCVLADFNKSCNSMTMEQIREADGSEDGSYIYAAYANDCMLYVGETKKSLKRRFFLDGSGAHKCTCWYKKTTTVKYKKLCPDDEKYRKLLERALILAGEPKHNDGQ